VVFFLCDEKTDRSKQLLESMREDVHHFDAIWRQRPHHLFHVLTKGPEPIGDAYGTADSSLGCIFKNPEHDLQGWCMVLSASKKACCLEVITPSCEM